MRNWRAGCICILRWLQSSVIRAVKLVRFDSAQRRGSTNTCLPVSTGGSTYAHVQHVFFGVLLCVLVVIWGLWSRTPPHLPANHDGIGACFWNFQLLVCCVLTRKLAQCTWGATLMTLTLTYLLTGKGKNMAGSLHVRKLGTLCKMYLNDAVCAVNITSVLTRRVLLSLRKTWKKLAF
jgi:hypothetical protein